MIFQFSNTTCHHHATKINKQDNPICQKSQRSRLQKNITVSCCVLDGENQAESSINCHHHWCSLQTDIGRPSMRGLCHLCWMTRDLLVVQKISLPEIMVVLLLLLLLLLAVDLEVETSRMPWLQMHTSSNTVLRRQGWNPVFGLFCTHHTG